MFKLATLSATVGNDSNGIFNLSIQVHDEIKKQVVKSLF